VPKILKSRSTEIYVRENPAPEFLLIFAFFQTTIKWEKRCSDRYDYDITEKAVELQQTA
jgi:hypothetical protein